MLYTHSIKHALYHDNCPKGVTNERFHHYQEKAKAVVESMKEAYEKQQLPWLHAVEDSQSIDEIESLANHIRGRYRKVLVLGMGGASLCGQALASLMRKSNDTYGKKPELVFVDTLDPHTIQELLHEIEPLHTAFLVISKSGKTLETLSQASLFYYYVMQITGKKPPAGQFIVITEPKTSHLRRFAERIEATILPHATNIGGRYAIFSNVGLLPAAIAGLDIKAICQGAKSALDALFNESDNAVIDGAAIQAAIVEGDVNQSVYMAYSDQLRGLVDWVRQLIAEGLGKEGKGITPVKAMGTMDQHSQLQLFLDGPKDKLFTLISAVPNIPHLEIHLPQKENSWNNGLEGNSLSEIVQAECQATIQALITKQCPVRVMEVNNLNEESLGRLAMHFMLETIIIGGLMNVNPYDQPAVEIGKVIAQEILMEKQKERTGV